MDTQREATPRRRIAIFGGSFDPVHLGHTAIASAALEQCQLDSLIVVPCWQSPHKRDQVTAPARHRLQMLALALSGIERVEISDWELKRDTPSYSWMTAEHFAAVHPDVELCWILGTDQWNSIESWAKPERLADLLTFLVFPRGDEPVKREGFRYEVIDIRHPASSTEARSRIASGEDTEGILDPLVAEYIAEAGLYP